MRLCDWWTGVSTHMWRLYFRVRQNETYDTLTHADKRKYDACENVLITRFGEADRKIIEAFYRERTNWGDNAYVVEDYSARTGISTSYIWKTIKQASRYAAEEIGILDRKDEVRKT